MIIALCGQKGGSGKSTIAAFLASELLARGRTALVVDADPQKTCLTWQSVAAAAGLACPSVVAMDGFSLSAPGQVLAMAKAAEFVIIDTPASHGKVQDEALKVADVAILPCGPSAAEAWAMAESVDRVLDYIDRRRRKLRGAIVINRQRPRSALGKTARQALAARGLPVLAAELGTRQAFIDALATGHGVTDYAPRDAAAAELKALLEEVIAL